MNPERATATDSASTRAALLDAAQQIMLEEGYAAVSTRRIAALSGANSALVYYYFGNMDNLFVELFRRGAERSYRNQVEALNSAQPLWALWESIHDQSQNELTMEFVALANHRKAIRTEITESSRRFRALQLDAVTAVLAKHGDRPRPYTPGALVLLMSSISRFLRMEEAFGIDTGHAETIELIETFLRDIEGDRVREPLSAATDPATP